MSDDIQLSMFNCEDLPLWSGAPAGRAPDAAPDAEPAPRQGTWAKCRLCLDTGQVNQRGQQTPCWCEAGDRIRERRRQAGRR